MGCHGFAQLTQRGVKHNVVAFLAQGGRRKHTMPNELRHKAGGRSVVQMVGIVPLL